MFYVLINNDDMYCPYQIIGRELLPEEIKPDTDKTVLKIDGEKVQMLHNYTDGSYAWFDIDIAENPINIADSQGCKKLCPACNKVIDYFIYKCDGCGYMWP